MMIHHQHTLTRLGGVLVTRVQSKKYVMQYLQHLLECTNDAEEYDREACADAIGFCASTHFRIVVDVLNQAFKCKTPSRSYYSDRNNYY